MDNVLDNPVWNAMTSSNKHLASGTEWVKIFPEDVSPFAGLKYLNGPSLKQLFHLLPYKRVVALVTPHDLEMPEYFKIIHRPKVLQLVGEDMKAIPPVNGTIVPLDKQHVPQMLTLTTLTNPGPFLQRTIEFGNYRGIFSSGKLVAMAGQRLHVNEYIEISAVCAHPDHEGKGYGTALITDQVCHIVAGGNIPFLHVMANNHHAINLYRRLGFVVRQELNFYVIQKNRE